MTNALSRYPSMRAASVGYLLTLSLSYIGMVVLATALGAIYQDSVGRDPMAAINGAGLPALFFVWFLAYLIRLIFWTRVSPKRQGQVQTFVVAVAGIEVVLALAGLIMLWSMSNTSRSPSGFSISAMIVATLFQIATITWLVRYRHE